MELERSSSGCELVAEVARRFGEVRLKATGASMLPAVWPGDILTVRRCTVGELHLGQIVLYRSHGKLVAHRVVRIGGAQLITRGDSIPHDDFPTCESDLIGHVTSHFRRGRPVSRGFSLWHRIGAQILQRSDFCLRAVLLVTRSRRPPQDKEISWA